MRAITGAVLSSKPCSLSKAFRILDLFYDSAASNLPSADCATYLRTVADATKDHELFRRGLRANQQQVVANLDEGERRHQDRDRKDERKHQDRDRKEEDMAGSHRDYAVVVELDGAAGEKKSKKKKNKEVSQELRAVAGVESHIPSSLEIAKENRRKQKHSIIVDVKQEPDLAAEEELVSEKKSKKKKEKNHVKVEEEAMDVNEVGGKIVNDGGLQQIVADEEKKRKKKKHREVEVNSKDVKQEEKMVSDGDLDNEKRRKKKRGRGDNANNALEQVEHTAKKQRK